MKSPSHAQESLISLNDASLSLGGHKVWQQLTIDITPGEFVAVLGPNGSGKTSLMRTLLGLQQLDEGSTRVLGKPASRGNNRIGYIPQQKSFDRDLPLRGIDLVRLGLDGHAFGIRRRSNDILVHTAIEQVEASAFAQRPVGELSGGQQQRLRVAQAIVSQPSILLCDEPLLSLDLGSQRTITKLIDTYRKREQASVLFVTHEINPVLPYVDRLLYLAGKKWAIGAPAEILQKEQLSELYGSPVEVIDVHGHTHIIADESDIHATGDHHHDGAAR